MYALTKGILIAAALYVALVLGMSQSASRPLHVNWDKIAQENGVLIGNDTRDFCSGTIIGFGVDASGPYSLVLSAAHCFNGDTFGNFVSREYNTWHDADKAVAIIMGQNKQTDVAILKVQLRTNDTCAKVNRGPHDPVRGEFVVILASPGAQQKDASAVTQGIVAMPVRTRDFGDMLHNLFATTAFVIGGSSGGSAFDAVGRIIGVVTGKVPDTTFSLISPISDTHALIDKLNLEDNVCYG